MAASKFGFYAALATFTVVDTIVFDDKTKSIVQVHGNPDSRHANARVVKLSDVAAAKLGEAKIKPISEDEYNAVIAEGMKRQKRADVKAAETEAKAEAAREGADPDAVPAGKGKKDADDKKGGAK